MLTASFVSEPAKQICLLPFRVTSPLLQWLKFVPIAWASWTCWNSIFFQFWVSFFSGSNLHTRRTYANSPCWNFIFLQFESLFQWLEFTHRQNLCEFDLLELHLPSVLSPFLQWLEFTHTQNLCRFAMLGLNLRLDQSHKVNGGLFFASFFKNIFFSLYGRRSNDNVLKAAISTAVYCWKSFSDGFRHVRFCCYLTPILTSALEVS